MTTKVIVLLLAVTALVSAEQKTYNGDKVFQLYPATEDHLAILRQFLDAPSDQFDFWEEPSYVNNPVDIHIGAASVGMFTNLMKTVQMPYKQLIGDVQEMIDNVNVQNAKNRNTRASIVGTYPTLDALNTWLEEVCSQNTGLATCGNVGTSFEQRTFKWIKLGADSATPKQKIWIEGTMHAREWLSVGTVVYLIDRLVNKYATDPEAKRMLDTYDWYIVPVSNPDGYEYSRTKERLWRKTRSNYGSKTCLGADPNRNWNYTFGANGASSSPCSDTYRGKSAFSEPETKALSDFITANKDNTRVYFSIHTYSQLWLIPYGVKQGGTSKPSDYAELERVAKVGVAALQAVNKKVWKAGNIVDLLYEASGGSIDWAKAVAGMKYSYCLELRPGKGSFNGFVQPESEIDPSGREVWAGLIAAIDAIPN